MSSTEHPEQDLTTALRLLVEDPVVPPQLADTVISRHRRAQALRIASVTVGSAVAVIALLGGALLLQHPGADRTAEPAGSSAARRPAAVRDSRFVATVSFDGDGLVVQPPPPGEPVLTRSQALQVFRATGVSARATQSLLVGYATATIRTDLARNGVPALVRHPAWVVIDPALVVHCPMMTAPAAAAPVRQVVLLDAAGHEPAVLYVERGSICGRPPAGPQVTLIGPAGVSDR